MPQTFEGFDFTRPQNVQKSAKDSFAELSNKAPLAPIQDKQALGQWFQQYIQNGMNERGHKVSAVDGDKFRYANHEGDFWVDYGRGAGAPGGALAWQAEPGDAATAARYPQAQRQGQRIGSVGSSDLMTEILSALTAQTTPDSQSLLLQALR